jgi:hypothetical protein
MSDLRKTLSEYMLRDDDSRRIAELESSFQTFVDNIQVLAEITMGDKALLREYLDKVDRLREDVDSRIKELKVHKTAT